MPDRFEKSCSAPVLRPDTMTKHEKYPFNEG